MKEEKQKNKKQIEDEFLHSLAHTICKSQNHNLAADIFYGTLKILSNKLGENLQDSPLPLG